MFFDFGFDLGYNHFLLRFYAFFIIILGFLSIGLV
jgi:hypothetical protein